MRLDHDLITALIERWRPETHTFHMPEGGCTVTLQDVNIISGLPINGRAITGRVSGQWIQMIYDFLGHQLDVESTDIKVQRYARAYMLCLIGGFLFPNKSTQYVHLMWLPLLRDFTSAGGLSWGSACLAWLYREMCRASHVVAEQISGPLFILQIWAWEHFPFIARTPSYIHNSVGHRGIPTHALRSSVRITSSVQCLYLYTFIFCLTNKNFTKWGRWIERGNEGEQVEHNVEVYRYQFDRLAPNEVTNIQLLYLVISFSN
ncbi:Serine/threonine-protein phosphatase 7 long form homolog [Linum perenne]